MYSLKHMTHKHRADSWLVPRAPQALMLPPATHFNEDEPHHAAKRVTSIQQNKAMPKKLGWKIKNKMRQRR
jgi:hypothetical protein